VCKEAALVLVIFEPPCIWLSVLPLFSEQCSVCENCIYKEVYKILFLFIVYRLVHFSGKGNIITVHAMKGYGKVEL
jgi:hypothetical protein